jgi:hypothetical protein
MIPVFANSSYIHGFFLTVARVETVQGSNSARQFKPKKPLNSRRARRPPGVCLSSSLQQRGRNLRGAFCLTPTTAKKDLSEKLSKKRQSAGLPEIV